MTNCRESENQKIRERKKERENRRRKKKKKERKKGRREKREEKERKKENWYWPVRHCRSEAVVRQSVSGVTVLGTQAA